MILQHTCMLTPARVADRSCYHPQSVTLRCQRNLASRRLWAAIALLRAFLSDVNIVLLLSISCALLPRPPKSTLCTKACQLNCFDSTALAFGLSLLSTSLYTILAPWSPQKHIIAQTACTPRSDQAREDMSGHFCGPVRCRRSSLWRWRKASFLPFLSC